MNTQFKRVALMVSREATGITGTDRFAVLSPVVEGADGSSRAIYTIEGDESVKIEDDQTVLSKLSETIDCVAMMDESNYAKLSTWAQEGYKVGFAGYTIGGLGVAPNTHSDGGLENAFRAGANSTAAIYASNPNLYDISSYNVVNAPKRMVRFKLTKHSVGGTNQTSGVKGNAFPESSILGSFIATSFTGVNATATPAYFYSDNAVTYANTASGVEFRSTTASGVKSFNNRTFFPFEGATVRFTTTLYGATGVDFAALNTTMRVLALNIGGAGIGSETIVSIPNATSTVTASYTIPAGAAFLRVGYDVDYTQATGRLGVSSMKVEVLK
jgi:hypothetical protein